VLKRPPVK
jgi:hypothetical protein